MDATGLTDVLLSSQQSMAAESAEVQIEHIALDLIDPSPRNPRRSLDDLDELAASIAAYGLLQPVVLRRMGERYQVVAGHRRVAALRALGWAAVPALTRQVAESEAYILTLIENLQRDDLSPREEAQALEVLLREQGWGTRQVAEAIKRSPAYVSKRLRVFEDAILAPLVLENKLRVSTAEELLPLPEERKRVVAREAAERGLDQRQIRAHIQRRFGAKQRDKTRLQLRKHARQLRSTLRTIFPEDIGDIEARELRLLFVELAKLARAPRQRQVVIPSLPAPRASRRKAAG